MYPVFLYLTDFNVIPNLCIVFFLYDCVLQSLVVTSEIVIGNLFDTHVTFMTYEYLYIILTINLYNHNHETLM